MTGQFIVGAAIGSGSVALAAERGGADILLAINAGRLRNMGAPSIASMLPILDARSLSEPFAQQELLSQCTVPVLVGVNVWEEAFDPQATARRISDAGFAGAVNFPSCMHYSRPMQQILSRAGRGIEREVEQLRIVQDHGLTAMFYCATRTQARLAADAGLDAVCLNLGWNVGGIMGHRSRTSIEEVATAVHEIGRLVKRINPKTKFLLEGGPIATAEDLQRLARRAQIDGYVGGSTIERMPLEVSVAEQINRFRAAHRDSLALDRPDAELVRWAAGFGFVGEAQAQLAFLRRLKTLSAGRETVAILAEPGTPTMRTVAALAGSQAALSSLIAIDVAGEDYPERARNILFGHRETINRRRPALADTDAAHLVVHSCARLSVATQRRLARAIADGTFRAPVTRRSMAVQPRILLVVETIAQPGREKEALAAAGVAPDLIAALAGRMLRIPPVRERIEDLPAILESAMEPTTDGATHPAFSFTRAAVNALEAHRWPGNEQEIETMLGALAGSVPGGTIDGERVLPLLHPDTGAVSDQRTEKDRIVDALWRHGFNRTKTADALGISRKTLYNKIKKFGLDR